VPKYFNMMMKPSFQTWLCLAAVDSDWVWRTPTRQEGVHKYLPTLPPSLVFGTLQCFAAVDSD